MSNTVPEGWKVIPFEVVFTEIKNGCSLDQNGSGNGLPVTRIETISNGKIDYSKTGWLYTTQDIERFRIDKGDILFSHINSLKHIGKTAIKDDDRLLYHGMNLLRFKIDRSKFSPTYFQNLLSWEVVREDMRKKAKQAINQASLNVQDIKTTAYPIPPLPEQQKIAAILSSVDDVIEKTRAQIDKLKDLKTGMMQELLTKGIGSGGVPHTEFKDSPVGRIPASWVVKTVGDLGSVVTGSTPKTASREYYGGSIPFISPSDINHSMYIRKTVNSLTEAGLRETRELPTGTVCVVCIGSTIGKTGITTFRCATNQQVNAVICRGTHPEFVYYLLTYYSKVIKAEAGTQAVPIINKSAFSALPVQVPGYDEQVEIGNSIASVDSQISLLENKLQSANSLKKALMQDLLTGKVRVKVDQKESAVA